ncbi:MAG: hypothetical protein H0W68_05270 [Gemmatimonadaceae bacterium]|nr:hypothetical protein [Gemmatimonadaceae bacterium]
MKNRFSIAAAVMGLLLVATAARAQDDHKPGGLNKIAHDVSSTVKKAGRDTKAEVKRTGSHTHNALTDAGNGTKSVLKKTTGIKGSQSHQPGGLNKVARNVSKTFKRAGSDTKAEKNRVKSNAHGAATEMGKSVKDTTLKGKP